MPSGIAHGATKNISDNSSAVSRDCRSKALATAPHLNPTHVAHLSHSSTPKRTKKPPCAQQESQCARRLKERIARGGLVISVPSLLFYVFSIHANYDRTCNSKIWNGLLNFLHHSTYRIHHGPSPLLDFCPNYISCIEFKAKSCFCIKLRIC